MPENPMVSKEALDVALSQVSMLQNFVYGLSGTIGAMGLFLGMKWIGALQEGTKADVEAATANKALADAVNRMAEAVNRGRS